MVNNEIILDSEATDNIWEDITNITKLLIKHGYDCLVRYEDAGVYNIRYASSNRQLGEGGFMQLSEKEIEMICANRLEMGNID